jgi:WD40 repeat protein
VKGNAITSIQLSLNNFNLISRSMDDTLKLWDTRNPSKAIAIQSNLDIFHEESNCIYSPNEKFVLTGVAAKEKNPGYICVFNSVSLEEEGKVELPSSGVSLLWPSKMEQLFCGLADGSVKAHYDPQTSNGGVTLPILSASKKLAIDDYDKFVGSVDIQGEMEDEMPVGQDRRKQKNEWTKKRNMTKPGLL